MMADDIKTAAKNATDQAGDFTKHAADSARDKASRVGSTAQDYASQASDTASDLYGNAKTNFANAAGRLPSSAADAMDAGQQAYRNGSEALGKQISKQPIEALLLAGAIGYLVGWAANRA